MADAINLGPIEWSMVRDSLWHREYKITFRVKVPHTETFDGNGMVLTRIVHGPGCALEADGLPQFGDMWSQGDDNDGGAWCRPDIEIEPQITVEPCELFLLKYTYSSKPLPNCVPGIVEDVLLTPPKIRTSSQKQKQEAAVDRWRQPLLYSSHEQIRGAQAEFDNSIFVVSIEQVAPAIDPELEIAQDTLNDAPLWGFPKRCVKLSRVSQTCLFTGVCVSYVLQSLEFECRRDTWDRWVLDEGTKAIQGNWSYNGALQKYVYAVREGADPSNPSDFERFVDYRGNPARVVLDGQGFPADVAVYTFSQFIAIQNTDGEKLNNSAFWRVLTGEAAGEDWTVGTSYRRGQVVQRAGIYYLADRDVPSEDEREPATASDAWLVIGGVPIEVGTYTPATSYARGSVVQNDFSIRPPGRILVSVYEESDFLTLGIPVNLECPEVW